MFTVGGRGAHVPGHMWVSEDNLQEVFSPPTSWLRETELRFAGHGSEVFTH